MAARWRAVNGTLRGLGIAHNDLQHGNVMVQDQAALRLVDYDGIFLPRFQGEDSPELGHRHYQHPKRSAQDYHAGIDNFPSLVVYLSLLALRTDPRLWDRFYTQDNLLFTKDDFVDPANSDCFKVLKSSPDANVAELAVSLEELCARPLDQVPDLESVMQGTLTAHPLPASVSARTVHTLTGGSASYGNPIPKLEEPRRSTSQGPMQAKPVNQAPERKQTIQAHCPNCNGRNARLRRDWYCRTNILRCLNCDGIFGKTQVKRCPSCGSQKARLRRDWWHRARPLRCRACNVVYGGTDERAPNEPVVSKTPHLNRLLHEAAGLHVEHETLVDRARGVMMGIAAGNLLGLAAEGWSHRDIAVKYPAGIRDIDPKEVARRMDDDLAQSIELAEALSNEGNTIGMLGMFAKRLIAWRRANGRGIGHTTRQSIAQLADGMELPHAAYAVYRAKSGIAPNGGIMRCAPVAIYHRTRPALLTRMSADTCAVTHYSPLSQWSCVVTNVAIAMLLAGSEPDLQKLLETWPESQHSRDRRFLSVESRWYSGCNGGYRQNLCRTELECVCIA